MCFSLLQLPCFWILTAGQPPAKAAFLLAVSALLFQLFLCDGLYFLLQDQWTLSIALLGALNCLLQAQSLAEGIESLRLRLLLAEAVFGLWLLCALTASILGQPPVMGMGDAKLMAAAALLLGRRLVPALTAASLLSGLWAAGLLILSALQKTEKRDRIAFGPFLVIGFLLYL